MQDNHIISSELTSLEAVNLFISDEESFEDICANIRQELSPDSISESILVDNFIYHQAMVSFLRQSKASMLAHTKINAAEQIFRTYGNYGGSYYSDELKDKAKNLIKGEKHALKDYHNIILKIFIIVPENFGSNSQFPTYLPGFCAEIMLPID